VRNDTLADVVDELRLTALFFSSVFVPLVFPLPLLGGKRVAEQNLAETERDRRAQRRQV
jgi:hypothetical protein